MHHNNLKPTNNNPQTGHASWHASSVSSSVTSPWVTSVRSHPNNPSWNSGNERLLECICVLDKWWLPSVSQTLGSFFIYLSFSARVYHACLWVPIRGTHLIHRSCGLSHLDGYRRRFYQRFTACPTRHPAVSSRQCTTRIDRVCHLEFERDIRSAN